FRRGFLADHLRMPYGGDDSNDRGPRIGVVDPEVFSDWIVIWPILARKIFVDHGDSLRALSIVRGEGASPHERDAHGLEIIWADLANVPVRARIAGEFRAAFDFK